MAKLYFRYGAMGSSKTANALMVCYNYEERGQKVLLAKHFLSQFVVSANIDRLFVQWIKTGWISDS